MINMSKVEKRIKKALDTVDNVLVVGHGFGMMETLIPMFQTVFVIDKTFPKVKARNLVYKEDYSDLNNVVGISAIFIGLDDLLEIPNIVPVLHKTKPTLFVEGHMTIEREFSGPLYAAGYRCVDLQPTYHLWKYNP